LLIALVAFIIATFVSRSLAIAIATGVVFWLCFTYERKKTFEKEASKPEEKRKLFEQRKKDFAEALEQPWSLMTTLGEGGPLRGSPLPRHHVQERGGREEDEHTDAAWRELPPIHSIPRMVIGASFRRAEP
jgi:hypothetical protein